MCVSSILRRDKEEEKMSRRTKHLKNANKLRGHEEWTLTAAFIVVHRLDYMSSHNVGVFTVSGA